MELTRLKKKRITAIRGHKLLKDKRDELMRQYLDLVRENMEVRLRVEEGILSANRNFVIARAGMSEAALIHRIGMICSCLTCSDSFIFQTGQRVRTDRVIEDRKRRWRYWLRNK